MALSYLPSSVQAILFTFQSCFTAPSFCNFVAYVVGSILCPGRHWLSRSYLVARTLGYSKHPSSFYRFFSRARWSLDSVGKALFLMLLPLTGGHVVLLVDDTLCRRTGPNVFGAAMHVDVARSRAYGPRGSRRLTFALGHVWVVLAVWLPLPWDCERGIALPVLFRLYRGKKRCPAAQYRKRTELARELVELAVSWLPEGHTVSVVADREYTCTTVLRRLPSQVRFTGPIPMDAALFELPKKKPSGRGRPSTRGQRLPTPADLATKATWRAVTLPLYGRRVSIKVFSRTCIWYSTTRGRPVRLVMTRDPSGTYRDRAFITTDLERPVEDLIQEFARRWPLEVTFRDAKQVLRVNDPQNGWSRRPQASHRPRWDSPTRMDRGASAAERTCPIAFITYSLVVAWYLRRGRSRGDVRKARALRFWHRHKERPSFADMLAAMQRALWEAHFLREVPSRRFRTKVLAAIPPCVWAA